MYSRILRILEKYNFKLLGGGGQGREGGFPSTFPTWLRKINSTFFLFLKLFFLDATLLKMNYEK